MPLSHFTLTVSHLPTSTAFFLACLKPLGYQFMGRHDDYIGFGQNTGEPADFWITEQKPGTPAGAAHLAFPAPSREAVSSFFIHALKSGGKIHGEPKCRDADSGYYSAAVIDQDGNSVEAVYRPSMSSARSEVSRAPTMAMIESGSVVSKASSKASSVKTESIAPPRSEAKSYLSKATTAVDRERSMPLERATSERSAPSVVSQQTQQIQQAPSPTYVVHHTTQNTTQQTNDDGSTAKTIVGSLIGAAAGAAIAYAWSKNDSSESTPQSQSQSQSQYSPRDLTQLLPSFAPSQSEPQPYRAIEAAPARSTYSQSEVRSTLSRSVTSKNPRASTIYEGTEFYPRGGGAGDGSVYDDNGRRASEGSVYSSASRELPIRAIEYSPPSRAGTYPKEPSTFISSFVDQSYADKPRSVSMDKGSGSGSVYSTSTIKPPKSEYSKAPKSEYREASGSGSQYSHHSSRSAAKSQAPSTASSARTPRNIPLPEGSIASMSSYRSANPAKSAVSARDIPLPEGSTISSYRSANKSGVSARDIPLPESLADGYSVAPDDSISQIDDTRNTRRSSYSHRSHSKPASQVSRRSSKFDEPVRPSDSISQVSSNVSKHTIKAGGGGASVAGSRAPSKVGSRRGSQAV